MRLYDDDEKYETEDSVRHMSFRSYSIEKLFFLQLRFPLHKMTWAVLYCTLSLILWIILRYSSCVVCVVLMWFLDSSSYCHLFSYFFLFSCMKQVTISETTVHMRLRSFWRRTRRWRNWICEVSITHTLSLILSWLSIRSRIMRV